MISGWSPQNMVFTLDEIWCLRNHVLHHGGAIDIHSSIHQVHKKHLKFSMLATPVASQPLTPPQAV